MIGYSEVIKEMGVVADHMNEMQRLCETYWSLIHSLANDAKLYEVSLSMPLYTCSQRESPKLL